MLIGINQVQQSIGDLSLHRIASTLMVCLTQINLFNNEITSNENKMSSLNLQNETVTSVNNTPQTENRIGPITNTNNNSLYYCKIQLMFTQLTNNLYEQNQDITKQNQELRLELTKQMRLMISKYISHLDKNYTTNPSS